MSKWGHVASGLQREWNVETVHVESRCWWHAKNVCTLFDTVKVYTLTVECFMGSWEVFETNPTTVALIPPPLPHSQFSCVRQCTMGTPSNFHIYAGCPSVRNLPLETSDPERRSPAILLTRTTQPHRKLTAAEAPPVFNYTYHDACRSSLHT